MFVKRFKKKCDVRGCKNTTEVFLISKRREMGNTVAMCRDCLKEALAETENYKESEKVIREDKPLFPHPELDVTKSSVADVVPEPNEVIEEATEEILMPVAEDSVTIKETPKAPTTNHKATKKPSKKK